MDLPPHIPDELADVIARRFHLLAEPARVRLIDRLRDGEATVHELAGELGTSQQNASRHLTLLAQAGMLARRKEGNCVYYRIADQGIVGLCDEVCGSVEHHLLDLATLVRPMVGSERSSR